MPQIFLEGGERGKGTQFVKKWKEGGKSSTHIFRGFRTGKGREELSNLSSSGGEGRRKKKGRSPDFALKEEREFPKN